MTPGENLIVQVGNTSTASPLGDSFVKRNDGVTVLCYADRGRGNSNAGMASNSQGDVTVDGSPGGAGIGGAPTSDATDYFAVGFFGQGAENEPVHNGGTANPAGYGADYGGGGFVATDLDENGAGVILGAIGAGSGLVCLQFFDSDPGY